MGERHVEELFSAAYDDALSDTERARYDAHLAGCERCTAAAAEFRAAIDAVRALPQAQMPVRVVLPATPPVAERRSLLPWLRMPVLSPATGGAVMALAGIAAVVVAVHVHGGGGAGTTAGSVPFGALAPQAQDQGLSHARSGGVGNSLADIGACPKPLAVTTAQPGVASAGNPAGFSNRVAVSNPQRPGQELVLATTSGRYAPGSQVLVFAALTTSGGQHTVVVPCVALQQLAESLTGGAAASAGHGTGPTASATAGGGSGSADLPAMAAPKAAAGSFSLYGYYSQLGGVPLAIAIPTSQSVAGTLPVQVVTIPDSVPHGTVLHLVALIPAGVPGASDKPAIEAVLTLDVS